MQTLDYIKAALMVFLLFMAGPAGGVFIRRKHKWQRAVFFALCFSAIGGFFQASEWGFTIMSHEYRGHSRGFHFFLSDFFAVILIFASMTGNWKNFKFFPPGFWIWMVYGLMCLLSFWNAPSVLFAFMALFKAVKVVLALVAAFNFIRTMDEMHYFLSCMAVTMFWELFVVLKMKYINHIYQVYGTFEHQNSLSMFCILIGMVFLAMALGPKHPKSNLYFGGFVACAAMVQSTLSRGGLAVFALGTVIVVALSLLDKPTKRRMVVTCSIAAIGLFGLAMTYGTIVARFNDYGTQESSNTRDQLNQSSQMMLRDYPLGIGLNNFALAINHPYPYADHIDYWHRINGNPVDRNYKKGVVESLYWLHLAETGYLGLAFFLIFLLYFIFLNLRSMWAFRTKALGALSMGILVGCGANYMQSFLERVLTQQRNMLLWFLLLAVAGKIEHWRRLEKQARKVSRQEPPFEQDNFSEIESEEYGQDAQKQPEPAPA